MSVSDSSNEPWVPLPQEGIKDIHAWQPDSPPYLTFWLRASVLATRIRPKGTGIAPGAGRGKRCWFTVSPEAFPLRTYARKFALFVPRVATEVFGEGTLMEDTWVLPEGSIVNVGRTGEQDPFTTASGRRIWLRGGGIQVEFRGWHDPDPGATGPK
jgi:hypothetical protein